MINLCNHRVTGAGVDVQLAFVIITGPDVALACSQSSLSVPSRMEGEGLPAGRQSVRGPVLDESEREEREQGVQVRLPLPRSQAWASLFLLLLLLLQQGCPLVGDSAASSEGAVLGCGGKVCCRRSGLLASRGMA